MHIITAVIIAACKGVALLQSEVKICLIKLKNCIINVFSLIDHNQLIKTLKMYLCKQEVHQ